MSNQTIGPRNDPRNKPRQEHEEHTPVDNRLIARVINVVTIGLTSGGPSSSARKRYARVHAIMVHEK